MRRETQRTRFWASAKARAECPPRGKCHLPAGNGLSLCSPAQQLFSVEIGHLCPTLKEKRTENLIDKQGPDAQCVSSTVLGAGEAAESKGQGCAFPGGGYRDGAKKRGLNQPVPSPLRKKRKTQDTRCGVGARVACRQTRGEGEAFLKQCLFLH